MRRTASQMSRHQPRAPTTLMPASTNAASVLGGVRAAPKQAHCIENCSPDIHGLITPKTSRPTVLYGELANGQLVHATQTSSLFEWFIKDIRLSPSALQDASTCGCIRPAQDACIRQRLVRRPRVSLSITLHRSKELLESSTTATTLPDRFDFGCKLPLGAAIA